MQTPKLRERPSLAALLAQCGRTRAEIGSATGCSKAAVSLWCRRQARPRPEVIAKICAFLEVTPAELDPYLADAVPIGRPVKIQSGR
ncbi:MAG: helix-turn-helix domain-containing protein [Hyphomicrobiaceae bacterium]